MPKDKDLEVEIYNEEQQFWANVVENSTATIQQFKDGMKLAEATISMAKAKIEEFSENQNI